MSEQEEQSGPGGLAGPAVTALASVAAAGVSYYAVRKAFARNGAGDSSEEAGDDSPASRRQEPEDSIDEQDDEATDGASAPDDEHDEEAGEDAEADESDSKPQAGRARGSGLLASASRALIPLAEETAEAAGRYLAEHGPDAVREKVVPRFIEAFEKAG